MCDQDHYEQDLHDYVERGAVTRREFSAISFGRITAAAISATTSPARSRPDALAETAAPSLLAPAIGVRWRERSDGVADGSDHQREYGGACVGFITVEGASQLREEASLLDCHLESVS